jgi:hypothetical protein
MLNMTTSQSRQPKGITTGGQSAPDTHAESTLLLNPATRDIVLSPGESESFQELADGDVIETLNVNRSNDGSGYWISPAKIQKSSSGCPHAALRQHRPQAYELQPPSLRAFAPSGERRGIAIPELPDRLRALNYPERDWITDHPGASRRRDPAAIRPHTTNNPERDWITDHPGASRRRDPAAIRPHTARIVLYVELSIDATVVAVTSVAACR